MDDIAQQITLNVNTNLILPIVDLVWDSSKETENGKRAFTLVKGHLIELGVLIKRFVYCEVIKPI